MHKLILAPVVALVSFLVVALWSYTVRAEETCTRRPMVQGMVGETVVTCETVRAEAPRKMAAKRSGRTVVAARLGARVLTMAPLVVRARPATARYSTTLRVAALDVDGTCGGLPAVCCDWRTGTRTVCGVSEF